MRLSSYTIFILHFLDICGSVICNRKTLHILTFAMLETVNVSGWLKLMIDLQIFTLIEFQKSIPESGNRA